MSGNVNRIIRAVPNYRHHPEEISRLVRRAVDRSRSRPPHATSNPAAFAATSNSAAETEGAAAMTWRHENFARGDARGRRGLA